MTLYEFTEYNTFILYMMTTRILFLKKYYFRRIFYGKNLYYVSIKFLNKLSQKSQKYYKNKFKIALLVLRAPVDYFKEGSKKVILNE